jgi:hypothetical protein
MTGFTYGTIATFLGCLAALAPGGAAWAQQPAPAKGRVAVARLTAEGMIRHEGPDKPWQVVPVKADLSSGDLLVGGAGGTLVSRNGAVQLTFLGDLDGLSPFPIVETAVILNPPAKDIDLDFTLDRGRVDLLNLKKKGPARVRVRIRDKAGEIVLAEPGAKAALEIYGRWVPGVRFTKEPKPGEAPTLAFVLLALKGEVEVKARGREVALKAPPGPALLIGDNIDDRESAPHHLDKLPAWATENVVTEDGKKAKAAIGKFREMAAKKSVAEAARALVHSDNATERRLGVNILAATDDLGQLAKAMGDAKHPDLWEYGVMALRHWIGRGPGQDQKLYKRLIEEGTYPPGEAEVVLNMLHSFSKEEMARPETYEALIDYLESDRLAIRALALWHLVRMVPEGKKIGYNPLAEKPERDKAIKKWRELVPHGKLPPKPKAGDK